MNKFKNFKQVLLVTLSLLIVQSCVKEDDYSIPELPCDEQPVTMTLHELVAMVDADTDGIVFFDQTEPIVVEGYVASSDEQGNFFKTVSIQDKLVNPTIGVQVEMDLTNLFRKFPIGHKIQIKLNGIYAGFDRGVIKIGETFLSGSETRVGRMAALKVPEHVQVTCTFDSITPTAFNNIEAAIEGAKLNTLIKINNVQFAQAGIPYSNPDAASDRRLLDDQGNSIIVRNSNFATFAGSLMPEGSGSLTAVISKYESTYQLFIRDTNDVEFNEPRFFVFEDGFTNLNNWTTHNIEGAQVWETRNFGIPAPCAYMSGFASGNQSNEDWLVSKPLAIPTGLNNLNLSFETDRNFSGNALEVFYTTNFTGDVTTTSWISLPAVFDTVNEWNTWTNSGSLDVSSAIGGNLYIAFKYTSTASGAATWELDNVKVIGGN